MAKKNFSHYYDGVSIYLDRDNIAEKTNESSARHVGCRSARHMHKHTIAFKRGSIFFCFSFGFPLRSAVRSMEARRVSGGEQRK